MADVVLIQTNANDIRSGWKGLDEIYEYWICSIGSEWNGGNLLRIHFTCFYERLLVVYASQGKVQLEKGDDAASVRVNGTKHIGGCMCVLQLTGIIHLEDERISNSTSKHIWHSPHSSYGWVSSLRHHTPSHAVDSVCHSRDGGILRIYILDLRSKSENHHRNSCCFIREIS